MAADRATLLKDVPDLVETERLRIEATRAGRGAMIAAAVVESYAELRPWMPWAKQAHSAEDCEIHCREMLAKWHAREELDFCFLRKSDGELIGKGGLHHIDWGIPRFEIGYWIRTSATRQGFATEGALGLVELARGLGAHRVEIGCDSSNEASRRVAEKSGFVLEGISRNARRNLSGELADSCLFARIF